MQRGVLVPLLGLMAWAGGASESVGVRVADIAIPVSAVTVPLAAVTVSEASVVGRSDSVAMRRELIAAVRGEGSEDQRLMALAQVWDQDDIFFLFFKPGEDRNPNIRVAAVNRLAEIDVLKAVGEKTGIPEVSQAIAQRLEGIYPDSRDREFGPGDSPVAAQYARRLKTRMR